MAEAEQLEELKSNLNLIKSMTGEKAEEEFYDLMEKAKKAFGDLHLYMGEFYFEYAKFLLDKMQKNIEIFNAKELPQVEEENGGPEAIPQHHDEDDDSSVQPKSENNVIHGEHIQQNGNEANADQPVIMDSNEGKQQEKGQTDIQKQEVEGGSNNQVANDEQEDDFGVCASNLLCALKIYETERDRIQNGGEPAILDLNEIQKFISRCRSRLGDLYHLNQNYTEAVDIYRQVISDEEKKLGHQCNRGLAEIHYMIANSFLYENKEGCEKIAIKQFIQAYHILMNHMKMLNPDDGANYGAPTEEQVKVDRFPYLPNPTDSEEIKEIKEVVSCLLDKIEDTYEQMTIRPQYQQEVQKLKEESHLNTFKEVSPDKPVVKLGTFGNRKKKVAEGEQKQEQSSKTKEKKQNEHSNSKN